MLPSQLEPSDDCANMNVCLKKQDAFPISFLFELHLGTAQMGQMQSDRKGGEHVTCLLAGAHHTMAHLMAFELKWIVDAKVTGGER